MYDVKQLQPGLRISGEPQKQARRVHDEQCVQYSHEMPFELHEAISRFIFRVVPLLYGGMFGALAHAMPAAMIIAALVSAGLDIAMGRYSMLRATGRSMARTGCPLMAAAARGTAWLLRAAGLNPPEALSQARCG